MSDGIAIQGKLPVGAIDTRAPGWWAMIFVVLTEAALFAYLLFSYFYLAVQPHMPGTFPEGGPPSLVLALPNTLILLASSVAVGWAQLGIQRGSQTRLVIGLAAGTLLGVVFLVVQYFEWAAKPFNIDTSAYASLYFTVTGFHMAHVVIGVLMLAALLLWSALRYFNRVRFAHVHIGALYWHFVDAVFSFFVAGLAGVSISRAVAPRILAHWLAGSAYRGMEVLIVAPHIGHGLTRLRTELAGQGCQDIRTICFDDKCPAVSWPVERRRLLQDVFDAARSAAHGEIYVIAGQLPFETVTSLMAGLRLIPRAVRFVPDEQVSALLQNSVHGLGNVVTLEMQKAPMSRSERVIKRAMDIAIATSVLLFISPMLAAIAVAIKLGSRGPLIFSQTRLGFRGQPFQILKFRSMTVLEDGDDIKQASRGDQRITRAGKWLRRSSLDELPQLWNVLKGEMAIVGPRPHAAAHDAHFAKLIENYEVRQHVKPGITGWAQVHGLRGETPVLDMMYRRIEADLWYASNCSLGLDVQILFKTVGAVLRQENAY